VVLGVVESEKVGRCTREETPCCGGGGSEIIFLDEMALFKGPDAQSLIGGEGE
jgi:hypothetical protein